MSWRPIDPRHHGCTFPPKSERSRRMTYDCNGCGKSWRWGGIGWTRINPDGTEWLAL